MEPGDRAAERARARRRARAARRRRMWLFALVVLVLAVVATGVMLRAGLFSADEESVRLDPNDTLRPVTETVEPTATTTVESSEAVQPEPAEKVDLVLAWQPSHQADTGFDGWKEYVICGDIVDRTIAELSEYRNVKAWDTRHGLTGSNNYRPRPSNTPAFDREVRLANEGGAEVFVSVHVDGGAPSGILGECMPGDENGRRLVEALVKRLSKDTGLPDRGVREVRLYSLEPTRNEAAYRCLLEVGDNAADRTFLENPANRGKVAKSLAGTIRGFDFELD